MGRLSSRLALVLAAVVAVPAALLPLVPGHLRPLNFAAFGAVAVFAAARCGRAGWAAALGLSLGAKLVSDLLNWRAHGFDPDYLPFGIPALGLFVYGGFAVYAALGWAVRGRGLVWGLSAALAGSVLFFLTTNFGAWLNQDLPYSRDLSGLIESYTLALPFYRGTLAGDLLFTGGLFAAHAALVRVLTPAVVPARG
jgi:hypothetical protein